MDKVVEQAVRRAIDAMHDGLGEPLTVDDLARAAMFSKFHFSRIFQRVTGLSPGRFLSALRLQRAKQLLVSTSLNVADITHEVGYNSVGTFSTRFTSAVGISPTTYRRLGGFVPQIPVDNGPDPAEASAKVTGAIRTGDDSLGATFIGLFPQPIPQGRPVSCTVLERPGDFTLQKVPPGSWYLLAHAVPIGYDEPAHLPGEDDQPVYVLQHGPLDIKEDHEVAVDELRLRPIRALDPPVLLALLDVRTMAMDAKPAPAQAPEQPTSAPIGTPVAAVVRDTAETYGRSRSDRDLVSSRPGSAIGGFTWQQRFAMREDPSRRNTPPTDRWRV
jgi:AraC family transcriptional regulator